METHSPPGQQLPLPLRELMYGPEEVILPLEPDFSVSYGRIKGDISTRVDKAVAPRRVAGLVIEGERFFTKILVRGQSYEVAGTVIARDVRPFGDPDADPQMIVDRVDVHMVKKYINGAYYRCDVTSEVSKVAERSVRSGYLQAITSQDSPSAIAA